MKKRAESAFGLHFDFHAKPGPVIGETLKEEDIREICRLIKPDFIQIDCKGHPGWVSYPTELGNAMPLFALDTLEMWRRVTREEGIALYMHYSGVWDSLYAERHPEDAIVLKDGTRSDKITRTFSLSYADKLLIPQLKEIAGKYGADGVWVDGECWATATDFHPETVSTFEKETGISLNGKLPCEKGDPYYEEYKNFCREVFRRYVRYYVDAVHKDYPDFQIASNWAYTDHMPEAVSANVDYLSGDFDPWNSFCVARYAGRFLAGQNKPWDLMAWNFRDQREGFPNKAGKHPVQIMQEAASVVSIGGGFQNYIMQYPDGSPRMEQIRKMKGVSEFVRAREKFCFRGKAVHQAAVFLSAHDRHLESEGLFSRTGYKRCVGLTSLFCDIGQSTEILSEHTLTDNANEFALIAVPNLAYGLEEDTIQKLLSYAENGGNLLLTGDNTARIFANRLGYTLTPPNSSGQWKFISADGEYAGLVKDACTIHASGETIVFMGDTERTINETACISLSYGKGKIAVIAADIGSQYIDCAQYIARHVLKAITDHLYTPIVKLESATGLVEITLLEKEGVKTVQLTNANGAHASVNCATEDFIPPALDISLSIKADIAPASLVLQPEGRMLPFTYENGRVCVNVDRIDIHSLIEIR